MLVIQLLSTLFKHFMIGRFRIFGIRPFAITRKLRIVGTNHIQFALDTNSDRFYVIKSSPYFDRITAFVSQSTGYPIAQVTAQLYAGKHLRDIDLAENYVHHAALIEPTMDHIAARVPIWGFNDLPKASRLLGTEKRSVGTVLVSAEALLKHFSKLLNPVITSQLTFILPLKSN